ncbi:hypothetical protein TNCV_4743251 [Trichonephila clavipes]|nr:hypothetical protein TNCV_4743251 [Trichonephila clavipes]
MRGNQWNELQQFFFRTSDCIENDTTMEDDSFRQESPVNTSKEPFFFPEFDLNKFSSCKSFIDCFDQQCLEYQKDEQWKKQNIPRYLTGVYLKFCPHRVSVEVPRYLPEYFRHPANGSQPCDTDRSNTGQRRPKPNRYW